MIYINIFVNNVCVFWKIIFSSKIDLFEATCYIETLMWVLLTLIRGLGLP